MAVLNFIGSVRTLSNLATAVAKNKLFKNKMNSEGYAQNYIVRALAAFGPGLGAKAAQLLNSKNFTAPCDFNKLLLSKNALQLLLNKEALELLENLSFFSFDGVPGSIGEVHKGAFKSGLEVAIKIQYPNINATINSQLLKLLKAISLSTQLSLKSFNQNTYLSFFKEKLNEETDYLLEAKNQAFLCEKLGNRLPIFIPKIFSQFSTKKILVQEWVDFFFLNQLSFLSEQEKQILAEELFETFLYLSRIPQAS